MADKKNILDTEYIIETVTEYQEFLGLRPVWENLAAQQGPYLPFLCFDWFELWLSLFLKKDQLFILLLRMEDEVVGIAPFLKTVDRLYGINVEKISLIGNVYSPYRYFLFADVNSRRRQQYIHTIFTYLSIYDRSWDIINLYGIPEENESFDVVKYATNQAFLAHSEYFCYANWYLDYIHYSGQAYIDNLPKKLRKDVAYCARRLKRIGDLSFEVIYNNNNLEHYIDLYYQVYSKSWQEKEDVGPTFHRDLAKMAAKHDWLRLGFLFLDNQPISCQFWLSCKDYVYILKTIYDQEYRKFSPGKILTSYLIKYVIDIDGVNTVDYGEGDELYKKDWTPMRRERKGLFVFNSNIRGRYLAFLYNTVLPRLRKYRRRAK